MERDRSTGELNRLTCLALGMAAHIEDSLAVLTEQAEALIDKARIAQQRYYQN